MNLYILRPKKYDANSDISVDPWEPWFDCNFGMIINASSEQHARQLAANDCGSEGEQAWQSSDLSTCKLLVSDDIAGVIITDCHRV